MAGHHNHAEVRIEDLRVANENLLGGRGQGHRLGQTRLGPARLAHCMRWIGQAEVALDMMVDRALNRYAHGSLLADKAGDSLLDDRGLGDGALPVETHGLARGVQDRPRRGLSRGSVDDEALRREPTQPDHRPRDPVHGALGYSLDTPLARMAQQARWARFADGADEVHQWRIAERTIEAYKRDRSTRTATGNLPL